jgi:hypothetical protein
MGGEEIPFFNSSIVLVIVLVLVLDLRRLTGYW